MPLLDSQDVTNMSRGHGNRHIIFHFFITHYQYGTYDMGIFAKLADNGLLDCSRVVYFYSRKCGRFGGACGAAHFGKRLLQLLRKVLAIQRGDIVYGPVGSPFVSLIHEFVPSIVSRC